MSDFQKKDSSAAVIAAGQGVGAGLCGAASIPGHHPGALAAVAPSPGRLVDADALIAHLEFSSTDMIFTKGLGDYHSKVVAKIAAFPPAAPFDQQNKPEAEDASDAARQVSTTPATPEGDAISRAAQIPQWLLTEWYKASSELLQECDDWLKLKRGNHPSATGLNFGETERRRELARQMFLDLAWLTGGSEIDAAPDRLLGISIFGLRALRSLPPQDGERAALPLIADYLRAPHMDAKREIDERARAWIDGNPDPWVAELSARAEKAEAALARANSRIAELTTRPSDEDLADLIEDLEKGVPAAGLHEDNATELFDIQVANHSMWEAAAALRAALTAQPVASETEKRADLHTEGMRTGPNTRYSGQAETFGADSSLIYVNKASQSVQPVAQFLATEDGEFNGNAQETVSGGRILSFEPGFLRVNVDGSGYFCVPDAEMVFEDDRQEGPDGPEGGIHWIARMDPSEIVALRDFLIRAHLVPAPVEVERIWVQFGTMGGLGRTIRKWDAAPFDGGIEFRAQSAPVGGEPVTVGVDLASGPDQTAVTLINPTQAALDVLAERQRQISAEGWTPEHDDQYGTGEMAGAAACYALTGVKHWAAAQAPGILWPWAKSWWKPTTTRRDLVKAGALILAEMERLDRAAPVGGEVKG